MASKQQETQTKTATDAGNDTSAEATAPSSSTAAAAVDNGGESSAKPKVRSTDPLLFLFHLLSFFPSLLSTSTDYDDYLTPPNTKHLTNRHRRVS